MIYPINQSHSPHH